MGITIGDSLAVVALLGGIGLSTWALIVAIGLLMPNKTKNAQQVLSNGPWRPLILGALITLTVGLFSVILLSAPNPATKLLGTVVLMWLLSGR